MKFNLGLGAVMKYLVGLFGDLVAVGGRQFFLCFNTWVGSITLFAFGILSEAGYLTITGGTVIAYIAGNQIQEHTNARISNGNIANDKAAKPVGNP